jgi:hypothetical protein
MSLVTKDDVKALVQAASVLSDAELQDVIDRVEAEVTGKIGAQYEDDSTTITETLRGGGKSIFVKRPIESVSSVTEYTQLSDETGNSLTENDEFFVWPDQGRIERIHYDWDTKVVVVYVPQDEREKRKRAIIDLVRLSIERTAQFQESVGGEYSYTAPGNWEREWRRVMRRLQFTVVG